MDGTYTEWMNAGMGGVVLRDGFHLVKYLHAFSRYLSSLSLRLVLRYDTMCFASPRMILLLVSQKMHITNELIHNPGVNEKLDEMDVNFVPGEG